MTILLATGISVHATYIWDERSLETKLFEKNLDNYYKQTIFSSIQNRGRVFFHVSGMYSYAPRLQFLTGAYLSYNSHIGEIFFKGQFTEAVRRENYFYYKDQLNIVTEKNDYRDFIIQKLSNRDTLIDRMKFLCSIKEIDHVVSDENLPMQKMDSTLENQSQLIYLYKCE